VRSWFVPLKHLKHLTDFELLEVNLTFCYVIIVTGNNLMADYGHG